MERKSAQRGIGLRVEDVQEAVALDAGVGPGAAIRSGVRGITLRQQRFERHLADVLKVDRPGLEVVDHLISDGPTTPTQLARQLGISTAAMTLVLNRLEAAGHIARERHPSDGRKLIVTASPSTAELAHGQVQPLIDGVEELTGSLSDADRATITAFLGRLAEVYEAATPSVKG